MPIEALTFGAIGALIATRHPRHAVAWYFVLLGLAAELWVALRGYGVYGMIVAPGTLPAPSFVAWTASWFYRIPAESLALLLLLFPTGRLPHPRWRWLLWLVVAMMFGAALTDAIRLPFLYPDVRFESPLRNTIPAELLAPVAAANEFLWAATGVAAAVSVVLRFRRAGSTERQQLKWFGYATALAVLGSVLQAVARVPASLLGQAPQVGPALEFFTLSIVVLAVPISVALAIFRYRLYDIDLLINRTLVYGATSAAIAATFFIGIVALQALLGPLTAGSELAIAVSTLVSFALFQPIRRRVQDAVDRRFDRSRYDAARTLDLFADRLRDEVDLDALREDLIGAVRQTMAPTHASLWLRERMRRLENV